MSHANAIYRGWSVLGGLFLVYAASNGILMLTLPQVYPALIAEFGWSVQQTTLPATIFFIVAAISSPAIGVLLDRYSAKRVILFGASAMVVGLLLFSQTTQLWHLVVANIVFALALSCCGIVATMLVLTRWFDRRRGRATGFLLLASSLGSTFFSKIMASGIEAYGWRTTILIFAALAAAIALLPAWLLVRNEPDETELTNSNERSPTRVAGSRGPTLWEAVQQPRFYLIALATGSIWMTLMALIQHQSIYFTQELSIAPAAVGNILAVFFAFNVVGKLSFGWLSELLDKGLTLVVAIFVLATSLLIMRSVDGTQLSFVFAYAAIAGLGFSGAFTTIQVWLASFYAGRSYGKILACITLIDTLSGAAGVALAAYAHGLSGSYKPFITLLIGVCATAAVIVAIVRPRTHTQQMGGST